MTQPNTLNPADDLHEGKPPKVKPQRRRFQFGISGLMVTVFGVAVGLSLSRNEECYLSDCFLAAVSFWFALGLLWQSRDLVEVLRRNRMFPIDRKFPLYFAIVWRLAITVSLVCHYVLLQLIGNRLLKIDENIYRPLTERSLLEIPFLLSLLVVLWSLCVVKQRKHGWYSRTIGVLGGIVCTVWIIYYCVDTACVPYLVYTAVSGIDMSEPIKCMSEPIKYRQNIFGFQRDQSHYYLFIGSLAAVALLISSIASYLVMLRRWQQPGKTRTIMAILAFICLALASVFPIWIHAFELKRLSAPLAETLWSHSLLHWSVGGLLCLASVSGVAWRLTRRAATPSNGPGDIAPANCRVYYHEQAMVIGCLFVGVLLALAGEYARSSPSFFSDLYYWFVAPSHCVSLAVFLMAAQVFWQRLRRPTDLPSPIGVVVSPGFYALTWIYLLGIVVVGAATLAWLGFSVWIVPYWTSYW